MNSKPEFTLNNIRNSPRVKVFQASELLTNEQKEEREKKQKARPKKKRQFDDVDAFTAEIMARFGYDAYLAWNKGEIKHETMLHMIAAERARERAAWIPLESIIISIVGSCIRRSKKEKPPKGPKKAQDIIKLEIKTARGEI